MSFTRVLTLGGGDAATYGLLGIACTNMRKYVAAESAFRMAALMEPGRIDWQMGLAETLFKQGRYADVAALTGALIDEHPERPELWILQATAYIGLGEPMRAAGAMLHRRRATETLRSASTSSASPRRPSRGRTPMPAAHR